MFSRFFLGLNRDESVSFLHMGFAPVDPHIPSRAIHVVITGFLNHTRGRYPGEALNFISGIFLDTYNCRESVDFRGIINKTGRKRR